MTARNAQPIPPLTPLWYHILIELLDGTNHGYGIIKGIEARTGGAFTTATGPVYLALQRLEERGLIEEREAAAAGGDARRRYYAITQDGRRVVRDEAQRLISMVGFAMDQDLLDRTSVDDVLGDHGR